MAVTPKQPNLVFLIFEDIHLFFCTVTHTNDLIRMYNFLDDQTCLRIAGPEDHPAIMCQKPIAERVKDVLFEIRTKS